MPWFWIRSYDGCSAIVSNSRVYTVFVEIPLWPDIIIGRSTFLLRPLPLVVWQSQLGADIRDMRATEDMDEI
jgi:hypothetical protein